MINKEVVYPATTFTLARKESIDRGIQFKRVNGFEQIQKIRAKADDIVLKQQMPCFEGKAASGAQIVHRWIRIREYQGA